MSKECKDYKVMPGDIVVTQHGTVIVDIKWKKGGTTQIKKIQK